MSDKFLYETVSNFKIGEKINTGQASIVKNGNLVVPIASPLDYGEGSNPAQLLALSIVSCFSLHLNDIETRDGLPKTGKVDVTVQLLSDEIGFEFAIDVNVGLPDLSKGKALEIIELLKLRCPTTKLFSNEAKIKYNLVDHQMN